MLFFNILTYNRVIMTKKSSLYFVLILLFLIVTACGPSQSEETTPTSFSSPEANSGYQAPVPLGNNAYPVPTQIIKAYPVPSVVDESKRFTIDQPLQAGNTEITGTGPANTPIKVVNISLIGESLGSGVIGNDGAFRIALSAPLEANHLIGLQLSDQDLESQFLDGPDYTNIPMIGLILAQAVVEP